MLPWGFTLAGREPARGFAVLRRPGDSLQVWMAADSVDLVLVRPFLATVKDLRGRMDGSGRITGTPEHRWRAAT
jgi:hypothetical protein